MKFLIPLLLGFVFIASGCIGQQTGGGGQPQPDEDLGSTLTPARDLTGDWSGSVEWTDNVGNPACAYQGTFFMQLQQDGNDLAGTWQLTVLGAEQLLTVPCGQLGAYPPTNLQGTVSSSSFQFNLDGDPTFADFEGTFTTDLIRGTWEGCSQDECPGIVSSVGSFTGSREL